MEVVATYRYSFHSHFSKAETSLERTQRRQQRLIPSYFWHHLKTKDWRYFEMKVLETQIKSSQWLFPSGTSGTFAPTSVWHQCFRPIHPRAWWEASGSRTFCGEPFHHARVRVQMTGMTMPFCRKNRSKEWWMFTDSRRCARNANSIWMYTSAWDSIKYHKIDFVFALCPSYSIPIGVIYCTSHQRWLKAFNIRPKFNCVANSFRNKQSAGKWN